MLIIWTPTINKDVEKAVCRKAIIAWTGYAINDKLIQYPVFDTSNTGVIPAIPTVIWVIWYNATTSTNIAVPPVMANLVDCDDVISVKILTKCETTLATGETRNVLEVITYDKAWVVVNKYYTLANTPNVILYATPPATVAVADQCTRVTLAWVASTTNAVVIGLPTIPAFAYGASISILAWSDIRFNTVANNIMPAWNGAGIWHLAAFGERIILHSREEITDFRYRSQNWLNANIYIEYYNTSIESGL